MSESHTSPPGPLGRLRRAPGACLSICLVLALTAAAASARSTLTARFPAPVAGPGIEQRAELVLDLFPGDGEAVLGAVVSFPGGVEVESAASALGGAGVTAGRVDIDYTEHPLGERAADTLAVVLRAAAAGSFPVDVTLLGNADVPGEAPHRARAMLTVEPPLRLRASLAPQDVYPGEAVELVLSVTNEDDRGIQEIEVEWPAGIAAGEAAPQSPIPAGGTSELSWSARLEPGAAGRLPLRVHAAGGGLRASPVAVAPLRVRPVPVFTARVPSGVAERGQPVRLALLWSNPGGEAIPCEELGARVAAGFEAAPAAGEISGGVEIEFAEDAVEVWLHGPGELGPGEERSVEVDLIPTGTGPFAWTGGFRPPGRDRSLDLGLSVVSVAAPPRPEGGPAAGVTDLELVSRGLGAALESALDAIPLAREASVSLAAEEEDDANWVVEGLVTRGLLRRGVRVLTDGGRHVLRYRVADARVVYSPGGLSFGPFGGGPGREGRAVVYLRLEDAGQRVLWVRRVDGRRQDPSVSHPAAWLSAGEGFPQSEVEPDHRYLELGLSGLIVGGLLFIFFAP